MVEEFLAVAQPNLSRDCLALVAGIYLKTDSSDVGQNLAMNVLLVPSNDIDGHVGPKIVYLFAVSRLGNSPS